MTRQEILKIAKPILFNTPMVGAILDNRKTATRRVVKPHNVKKAKHCEYVQGNGLWIKDGYIKDYSVSPCWIKIEDYIKRYYAYKLGDHLYVRETWYYESHMYEPSEGDALYRYVYRADEPDYPVNVGVGEYGWKPSIHMPKEAARLFLRVTDVRVERLQNITEEQAVSEGAFIYSPDFIPTYHYDKSKCHYPGSGWTTAKESFLWGIWNSTIRKSDLDCYGWSANPWVWVIEFERVVVK